MKRREVRRRKERMMAKKKERQYGEKEYRLIIAERGNEEIEIFTEDFDADVADYLPPGFSAVFDEVITAELPSIFPIDQPLQLRR